MNKSCEGNWTWEIKNNYGKWLPDTTTIESQIKPSEPAPTLESMIKDIQTRVKDKGFFDDMVEWLRKNAPRKLYNALHELSPPMHMGPVFYERLCEVLYHVGFRASERLERRLILGPVNRWVQEYFKDFSAGMPRDE